MIDCEAGWHPLIASLDAQLAELAPDHEVYQVKEKFGGLRYHAHLEARNDEARAAITELIREAENHSYRICERCGDPGKLSKRGGWHKTVRPTCAEELGFDALPERTTTED